MSETLTKLDNLRKIFRASARIVLVQYYGSRTKKSFVEIKPVSVVKHVEI